VRQLTIKLGRCKVDWQWGDVRVVTVGRQRDLGYCVLTTGLSEIGCQPQGWTRGGVLRGKRGVLTEDGNRSTLDKPETWTAQDRWGWAKKKRRGIQSQSDWGEAPRNNSLVHGNRETRESVQNGVRGKDWEKAKLRIDFTGCRAKKARAKFNLGGWLRPEAVSRCVAARGPGGKK